MFKKIGDMFRDKTVDELCENLRSIGLDAEIVQKGTPEDKERSDDIEGYLGGIKVRGKEFNFIEVILKKSGGDESATEKRYTVNYVVNFDVKELKENMKARIRWKTKGLIRKETLGAKWIGSKLAKKLNGDESLTDALVRGRQDGILKRINIDIEPDGKKPYVRIKVYHFWKSSWKWMTRKVTEPSKQALEWYNTIAKHIRSFYPSS